jgi:hypothetical protein
MPNERDTLLSSSQTIIKGTIVDEAHVPDLTLGEQLQFGGTPSVPKNGYKQEFTIRVDSVVKGTFQESFLQLHDLKDPKYPGMANPRLWLGPKQKVYVGWRSKSDGNFDGLMIVNVQKVYFSDATTVPDN